MFRMSYGSTPVSTYTFELDVIGQLHPELVFTVAEPDPRDNHVDLRNDLLKLSWMNGIYEKENYAHCFIAMNLWLMGDSYKKCDGFTIEQFLPNEEKEWDTDIYPVEVETEFFVTTKDGRLLKMTMPNVLPAEKFAGKKSGDIVKVILPLTVYHTFKDGKLVHTTDTLANVILNIKLRDSLIDHYALNEMIQYTQIESFEERYTKLMEKVNYGKIVETYPYKPNKPTNDHELDDDFEVTSWGDPIETSDDWEE